uniref:Uncharacterized protein n=1 Tax=Trypanosoma vivax (strain Y486) TaxID=1055687 RepID=G0TUI8_TRYVY|nr:conserved hypothetical protein, fragment [Trypanosoma vivax Y486]
MAENRSNSDKTLLVCLSAHCDLLHFAGPVPHPYSGPSLQTMANRTANYMQFKCGAATSEPSVTVSCNVPLFAPTPTEATVASDERGSHLSLSGPELARWAFERNFEPSAMRRDASNPHCRHKREEEGWFGGPGNGSVQGTEFPHVEATPRTISAAGSILRHTVNFVAVRRTLLQVLLILHQPSRSPAAAFKLLAHDPSLRGSTRFLVLPRCAERYPTLGHPVEVCMETVLNGEAQSISCSFQCSYSDSPMAEGRSVMATSKNNIEFCVQMLRWSLNCGTTQQTPNDDPHVQLSPFLTAKMVPMLFNAPVKLWERKAVDGEVASHINAWAQRRSFQLMALIAHCIWCEMLAWGISTVHDKHNKIASENAGTLSYGLHTARLKSRNEVSLGSNEKWETLLTFHESNSVQCGSEKQLPTAPVEIGNGLEGDSYKVFWVLVQGCDDYISWEWRGNRGHGTLQELFTALDAVFS